MENKNVTCPTSINSLEDLKLVVNDTTLSNLDKIAILTNKEGTYESVALATFLQEYEIKLSKPVDDKNINQMAAENYGLYNRLLSIVNIKDYTTFSTMFDMVNIFFRAYEKSSYDVYKLCRFDIQWKWGEKQLNTYNNLMVMITTLLNPMTRAMNIRTISLTSALDKETTTFTDRASINLRRYYDV